MMDTATSTLSRFPGRALPFLYRFEAQLEIHPIGLVPEGLRMANAFEGRVREGLMAGARVWGIDHLLLRSDGVAVIDAQKTLSLGKVNLYEHVRGYCLPPAGLSLPPLARLLEEDFVWPSDLFAVRGFSMFRAGTRELAFMNRALASIEGSASYATGALTIETRLLGSDRAGTGEQRGG